MYPATGEGLSTEARLSRERKMARRQTRIRRGSGNAEIGQHV